MSQQRISQALGVLLMLQLSPADARAEGVRVFECPAQLADGALTLAAAPSGWIGHVSAPLKLQSAGFMGSEPAKLVDLVPAARKESKTHLVETWDLRGAFDEGKWLACGYGGSLVTLAQRLPETVKRCSVTYQKSSRQGPQRITQIRCELGAN